MKAVIANLVLIAAAAGSCFAFAQTPAPTPAAGSLSAPPLSPAVRLFVVHLTTGSGWQKDVAPNEQAGFKEHSANLARLRTEGKLVLGARYKDSQADKGMIVLRAANRAEVEAEFARDPMIQSKHFVPDIADFNPFYDGYVPRPIRPAASTSPLAAFSWMAGCWEGRNGSVTTREHWMPEAGGMMLAMARTLREGKVLNYEAIRLETDADGVTPVYVPRPSGQKEARFRLVSSADGKAVFENLEHDFPQRIMYERRPDGSLLARIEGMRNGTLRGMDFPMRRAACD
jgi:hypothetical protein